MPIPILSVAVVLMLKWSLPSECPLRLKFAGVARTPAPHQAPAAMFQDQTLLPSCGVVVALTMLFHRKSCASVPSVTWFATGVVSVKTPKFPDFSGFAGIDNCWEP